MNLWHFRHRFHFIVPHLIQKFYYGYKNLQVGHKLFITVRYNKINFAVQ